MSAQHRRQLVAFFIVAFAAVLLIGNGLHNQSLRDIINGKSRIPTAIATGVTISLGQLSTEVGGSARGTTPTQPALVPATSDQAAGRTPTIRTTSLVRTSPGHSERAGKAQRAAQNSKAQNSKAQAKSTTKGNARSDSLVRARTDVTVSGSDKSTAGHGKKAHAKKHGKKHGKKHRRHRR
jgi:hypothetical protein